MVTLIAPDAYAMVLRCTPQSVTTPISGSMYAYSTPTSTAPSLASMMIINTTTSRSRYSANEVEPHRLYSPSDRGALRRRNRKMAANINRNDMPKNTNPVMTGLLAAHVTSYVPTWVPAGVVELAYMQKQPQEVVSTSHMAGDTRTHDSVEPMICEVATINIWRNMDLGDVFIRFLSLEAGLLLLLLIVFAFVFMSTRVA